MTLMPHHCWNTARATRSDDPHHPRLDEVGEIGPARSRRPASPRSRPTPARAYRLPPISASNAAREFVLSVLGQPSRALGHDKQEHKEQKRGNGGQRNMDDPLDLLEVDVDILIPAALENQITGRTPGESKPVSYPKRPTVRPRLKRTRSSTGRRSSSSPTSSAIPGE